MVIIPILGEALLDAKDIIQGSAAASQSIGLTALIAGFLTSFIVGCAACRWMISLVKRGGLEWFAIYCAIMGIVCIIW